MVCSQMHIIVGVLDTKVFVEKQWCEEWKGVGEAFPVAVCEPRQTTREATLREAWLSLLEGPFDLG